MRIRNDFEKIVINAGVGRASQNPTFNDKMLPQIMKDIASMTGQKAQIRPAAKSIAGFKMREGQTVGLRVTLRGERMVDFFQRLITIVLPRVRDFQGLKKSAVDASGVLNVGLKEQYVFPEITQEESPFLFPLGIAIVPRSKDRSGSISEYEALGVPFKKDEK